MSSTERLPVDRTNGIPFLLQRAEAAARQGHQDEARHLLKAVLRHDPTNDQALLRLVYLAEDDQASLTYLARLLDAHPRHPQARTAIRWARQQIPSSLPKETPRPERETPITSRRSARLLYGLALLVLLMGLGVAWQAGRSPAARVQDDDSPATPQSSALSPSSRPVMEVVKVSIPLFTPTPTPGAPAPATPPPRSALVPVLGQPQARYLSCESRSAADLAGYWNVTVDELEFLTALGQSDNPHKGFVGDVDSPPGSLPPYGYGVYAEPVAATLRDYGLDARSVYNLGLDGIREELLAGRPVLVWATYGMEPYTPLEWVSNDGHTSTVVPFMHTYLVTGFDQEGIFVLDAYDATVRHYPAEDLLTVWNYFDQMAVVVTGPLP